MSALHRNLVLGTAGHIDHGKTALVRALTGVDCDRLPEEKARGITVELGFAPLSLSDGTLLSVVDVPGHEGLVRTMVAGATGIDLMLLVVAADEGVMPQTREHIAICDLLGIAGGAVALTKCDATGGDVAELAEEEVRDLLAGTALANVPIVRTSAVSGDGIEALRAALEVAAGATRARTPRDGPPRLAVDRSFVMKGFGTVATGTLVGGALSVGEEIAVLPEGHRARVRGVQRHGEKLDGMESGARCAVNLQGVDVGQVPRGSVLARPDAMPLTQVFDARLRWLADAPPLEKPTSALLLTGTSEHAVRIAPIGPGTAPGGRGLVRIHLEHGELPVLPGDRFVVRGFARTRSGGHTLGGGTVLDANPPHRRVSDPELLRQLEALESGDDAEALGVRVDRAGLDGIGRDTLVRETGLAADRVDVELIGLRDAGRIEEGDGVWISAARVADLSRRILETLARFHNAEPLRPGMPLAAVRGALPDNTTEGAIERALAQLAAAAEIVIEGKTARRSEHATDIPEADRDLVEAIRRGAREAGLTPPSLREWCERLGCDEARLRDLLAWLGRAGEIVRAGELWFDAAAVDALRKRVREHLEREGELDTPRYKALIGTTRKHAVPLMELLDGEKLTIRRGEVRVLRNRAG
ncbi:MAG: selenocysteine-specific translation elongation factor [Deltaproteobacteria bacterium]|nr:selenocysteine-specific translation elongation factor [Deltaproteobacteria bacterium]MBW2444569.1 selenocysteine-specific translation elongation factor [Deltaproteobacteria bacterium]